MDTTRDKVRAQLDARPFLKTWRWIVWDTRCNAISGMYAKREDAEAEFARHIEAFPDRYQIIDGKEVHAEMDFVNRGAQRFVRR